MSWILFAQVIVLIPLTCFFLNLVANNAISHFWRESSKYYNELDHNGEDPRSVSISNTGHAIAHSGGKANTGVVYDDKPKPWTTGNAV